MLIFNCTKAAADFFTSTRQGKKTPPPIITADAPTLHDDHHWNWMVHIKKINRKNVLITMDADSRFCLLFWGLKKGKVQNFISQFHERLMFHLVTLLGMSAGDMTTFPVYMKAFFETHHTFEFVQRRERSVQGNINDVFLSLSYEQYRWADLFPNEEEIILMDIRFNDTPRKRKQDKDYIFPAETLVRSWFIRYAGFTEQGIEHSLNEYRQTKRRLQELPFDLDIDFDNTDLFKEAFELF